MQAAARFKDRRSSCRLQPDSRTGAVHAGCSQVQGPAQTSSSSKNAGPFCELKKLKLFDLTGKYLQCFSHEDECFAAGNRSISAACMNCCSISFLPHAVLKLLSELFPNPPEFLKLNSHRVKFIHIIIHIIHKSTAHIVHTARRLSFRIILSSRIQEIFRHKVQMQPPFTIKTDSPPELPDDCPPLSKFIFTESL